MSRSIDGSLPFLGRPELNSTYKCLTVRKAVLLMATAPATATHRLVCPILACVAGSGERQLRFDVVGDDGVDDLAVDPAVGLEVDAHPIGHRGSNRHSLFRRRSVPPNAPPQPRP